MTLTIDMAKEKKNKNKKGNFLKEIFMGRVVSVDFFRRNWLNVAGIIALFILFIASKYWVQSQLADIMKLQKELNNAKTDLVKASSEYNTRIREPEMRAMLDTLHIDLAVPEQPAYHLE